MPERVMIIGLDGADWRILKRFAQDGAMPNLQHLINHGVSGTLESAIPTHSNTAWASFMTGTNPGKHGVFSFMERSPRDPLRLVGVTSRSIRRETLFHILSRQGYKVGAINVPLTYPPFPVNGFLLSGMFVPEGATYTHPRELAAELDSAVGGFPLNRIRWRYMPGKFDALLAEAIGVNTQRLRVLTHLVEHKPWDVFTQVFVSPDRIQHALMHLIDPAHPRYREEDAAPYQERIRHFYRTLDDVLGVVAEHADRFGADLLVLSDHGFQSCDRGLVVQDALVQEGLLRYNGRARALRETRRLLRRWRRALGINGSPRTGGSGQRVRADIDWSRTQAYVATTTEQGIWINLLGREPRGIVGLDGQYDQTRQTVRDVLERLRDPETGNPLVERVWFREELYHGSFIDRAPDIVFLPASGLSVGAERQRNLAPLSVRTGEHDLHGILLGYGPNIRSQVTLSDARLIDLTPTILYLAGASLPSDLDGRVLTDMLQPDLVRKRKITYDDRSVAFRPQGRDYSQEEEAEIAEQLRGLGYL